MSSGDQGFDLRLRAWIRDVPPPTGRARRTALAMLATTPQRQPGRSWGIGRPGGVAVASGPTVAGRRAPRSVSLASATGIVIVAAVVALVGTVALRAPREGQDDPRPALGGDPSPATSIAPTIGPPIAPLLDARFGPYLPADLPSWADSGRVDTALGRARWVHLKGARADIPIESLVPGPSGLLTVGGQRLWSSADGLTWSSGPLPVEAESATLTLLDGTYWLVTASPTTLWRSSDAATWVPIDLGSLEAPAPADLDWEVVLGTPVGGHGVTVLPVTHRVRDTNALLGQETYRVDWPEERAPGAYRVMQATPRGYMEVATVRIAETPTGLRVTAEDGTVVAELAVVDIDLVRAWSAAHEIAEHRVGIVTGDSVTSVALPGLPYPDPSGQAAPALLAVADGFRAFATDPQGRMRTWWSEDGQAWEWLDSVRFDGSTSEVITVPRYGHPFEVRARGDRSWATTDGIARDRLQGLPIGNGWLAYNAGRGRLEAAKNGARTSVSIPGLTIDARERDSLENIQTSVGDTVFLQDVRYVDGSQRYDTWIIELESVSE